MKFIPLKIKRAIKEGIVDLRYFGLKVMFARIYWILSGESTKSIVYRNRVIVQWLTRHFGTLIEKYQLKEEQVVENKIDELKLWEFWWSGEEDMPEVIKMCHKSKKRCAGEHPVVLLTKDNLREYVEFPHYVWTQFENNQLRIQHLADMIRVQLIQRYGGIWLDASIYCVKKIPECFYEKPVFSLRSERDERYVSECRWTTFAIGGHRGNILYSFLNDFFIEYCKSGKPFIDYYMFDCAIAVAYNNLPQVKKSIDQLQKSEGSHYWLDEHLRDEANVIEHVVNDQEIFQKISWGNYVNNYPKKDSLYVALWQKEENYEKSKYYCTGI